MMTSALASEADMRTAVSMVAMWNKPASGHSGGVDRSISSQCRAQKADRTIEYIGKKARSKKLGRAFIILSAAIAYGTRSLLVERLPQIIGLVECGTGAISRASQSDPILSKNNRDDAPRNCCNIAPVQ